MLTPDSRTVQPVRGTHRRRESGGAVADIGPAGICLDSTRTTGGSGEALLDY